MTAGMMPSFTSVKPNTRVLGRDDDVADGGEAGAAAEGRAVHASDDRHRQLVERAEHRATRLRVAQVLVFRVGDVFAIHATSAPAQNDLAGAATARPHDARSASAVTLRGPGGQLADHLVVERVADLRAIERQVLDRPVASGRQELVGHQCLHEDTKSRSDCLRVTSWLRDKSHIRKTPNFGSGIGALNAADSPSARACRVSAGSRIPSSHRRAVE